MDARKSLDRDNTVVFKYIEDTAKLLEQQTLHEQQKIKYEQDKILKGIETHNCEKQKMKKSIKSIHEFTKNKQKLLDDEKKKKYEEMIREIKQKVIKKEISEMEGEKRLSNLKNREEELVFLCSQHKQ